MSEISIKGLYGNRAVATVLFLLLCFLHGRSVNPDDILVTVGGEPVTVGEFRYLYGQQIDSGASVDECLDRLVLYRRKICDARRNGLDTLPEFIEEYGFYRREMGSHLFADSLMDTLAARYPIDVNMKARADAEELFTRIGEYNIAAIDSLASWESLALSVGWMKLPMSEFAHKLPQCKVPLKAAMLVYDEAIRGVVTNILQECAIVEEESSNPEFASMIKKLHDGLLVYAVTDRNVWRKSMDPSVLEAHYAAHAEDYRWAEPHFKGWVVAAPDDSIAEAARILLDTRRPPHNEVVSLLRKEIGRQIRAEYTVMGRGENPLTDWLAFGSGQPDLEDKWKAWFTWEGRVIEQPEGYSDVKLPMTNDLQRILEQQWIDRLKKLYPAQVNRKVLDAVKKNKF